MSGAALGKFAGGVAIGASSATGQAVSLDTAMKNAESKSDTISSAVSGTLEMAGVGLGFAGSTADAAATATRATRNEAIRRVLGGGTNLPGAASVSALGADAIKWELLSTKLGRRCPEKCAELDLFITV